MLNEVNEKAVAIQKHISKKFHYADTFIDLNECQYVFTIDGFSHLTLSGRLIDQLDKNKISRFLDCCLIRPLYQFGKVEIIGFDAQSFRLKGSQAHLFDDVVSPLCISPFT